MSYVFLTIKVLKIYFVIPVTWINDDVFIIYKFAI